MNGREDRQQRARSRTTSRSTRASSSRTTCSAARRWCSRTSSIRAATFAESTNTGARSCAEARRIGANATIVCGVTLGEYAFIGAGAVVTRDVPAVRADGRCARRDGLGWMCGGAAATAVVPIRGPLRGWAAETTLTCARDQVHVDRARSHRACERRVERSAISSFRIALVGCGRISQQSLRRDREDRRARAVAACADVDRARAAAGERARHSVVHDRTRRCSRESKSTWSTICTPSGLHPRRAFSRRAPGSTSSPRSRWRSRSTAADELVAGVRRRGVHLFVVKQNRLNPPVQLLKRAVDEGRFGRIYLANCTVRWARPQEYYDQAPWRGTWEFDGGAFMNQASHYVDLMQWLVGPVESVMAKTATLARRIEAEDSGVAVLQVPDRARWACIEVTMLTYPEEPRGLDHDPRREGHGQDRRDGGQQGRALGVRRLRRRRQAASSARAPIRRTSTASATRATTGTSWRCCGARRRPDTDGRAGRKSLELILGIYESAQDRARSPAAR